MEWKILSLDKTIESRLNSDEEVAQLLQEASASMVENGPGTMTAYFYYSEGLFEQLLQNFADKPDMAKVLANDEHYQRLLDEQRIAEMGS